jgi:predicted RNase H-like HicB family nuclease
MRFPILIEPTATGFSGHVPDLPGCVAAGETREETIALLRDAIEFHLEGMRLHGEPAPSQTAIVEYVEVNPAVG